MKFLITCSFRHSSGATPLFVKRGAGGELVKLPVFKLFSWGLFYKNR
jgi:hypothetical protein